MAVKDKVADLTVDELKALIRETVREMLTEDSLDPDPDEGLELKPEIAARLRAAQKAKAEGKPRHRTSHDEVLKKLGLDR